MRHLTLGRALAAAGAVVALVAFLAWLVPSSSYLYVPNSAQPLEGKVEVEGGKLPDDTGGIYYVDVTVRSANWLERLLPFLRPDGSTIVPEHAVVPPGSDFEENHAAALREMERSEQVAAAVALRAAGYEIDAKPRGALVEVVDPDVPAARSLRRGDVIVEAAGKPIRTMDELRDAVGTVKPGEAVELGVRRGGKAVAATVRTVPAPDDPRRPVIGIRISQAADIELPVDVDIDLGDVGGPSAGLPFALDVLQELGRDVDHGLKVAATGEIGLDGSIGPIGGMKQKVFGVKRAGADVFLVPAGDNAEVARRFAGNLRVIEVQTFQQALRKLATLERK